MTRNEATKKDIARAITKSGASDSIHPEMAKVMERAIAMRKPLRTELSSASACLQAGLELTVELAIMATNNPSIAATISENRAARSKAFVNKLFSQAAAFVFDPQTPLETKAVLRFSDVAARHCGQGHSPLATAKKTINATPFGSYVRDPTAVNLPLFPLMGPDWLDMNEDKQTDRLFILKGTRNRIDRLVSYSSRAKPTQRKLKVTFSADGIEVNKIYPVAKKSSKTPARRAERTISARR